MDSYWLAHVRGQLTEVVPKDQTKVVRVGGKYLYLQNHLAIPHLTFYSRFKVIIWLGVMMHCP